MTSYTTIEEYNNYLVENQIIIDIIEYTKEVNKLEFKIELNFIDDFIELVSKKECCIHHDMLVKYGVFSLKGTTNDIKKCWIKIIFSKIKITSSETFRSSDLKEVLL